MSPQPISEWDRVRQREERRDFRIIAAFTFAISAAIWGLAIFVGPNPPDFFPGIELFVVGSSVLTWLVLTIATPLVIAVGWSLILALSV